MKRGKEEVIKNQLGRLLMAGRRDRGEVMMSPGSRSQEHLAGAEPTELRHVSGSL